MIVGRILYIESSLLSRERFTSHNTKYVQAYWAWANGYSRSPYRDKIFHYIKRK